MRGEMGEQREKHFLPSLTEMGVEIPGFCFWPSLGTCCLQMEPWWQLQGNRKMFTQYLVTKIRFNLVQIPYILAEFLRYYISYWESCIKSYSYARLGYIASARPAWLHNETLSQKIKDLGYNSVVELLPSMWKFISSIPKTEKKIP
jgi:hypothetical protein